MNEAAKKIAENVVLLAFSRVMLAVGTPMILAALMWGTSTLVLLDRSVALATAENARQNADIRDLQANRETAQQIARQMQQELAGIREGVTSQRRSLDRIEQYIDRQSSRSSN